MTNFLQDHQDTLAQLAWQGVVYHENNTDGSEAASGTDGMSTFKPSQKLVLPSNIYHLQRLISLSQFDPRIRQQLLNMFHSGKAQLSELKFIVEALAKSPNSSAIEILGQIMNVVPENLRQTFTAIISTVNQSQVAQVKQAMDADQEKQHGFQALPKLRP